MVSFLSRVRAVEDFVALPKNCIDLWLVKPSLIGDVELLNQYRQLLTPQELSRQLQYRVAVDRHDALVTRALVRTVLSRYCLPQQPIPPTDWRFVKGYKGKPEIDNPPLPLRFNISHTTDMILCAVALDVDLGVDVEYIKRKNSTLKIAQHKFSPSEVTELLSYPQAEQHQRFFDYWTLKESYIKAVGGGLSIPLDEFSFTIKGDNDIALSFSPNRNDDPSQWQNWLMWGSDEHRIAVSIKDPHRQPHQIRTFTTVPLRSACQIRLQ